MHLQSRKDQSSQYRNVKINIAEGGAKVGRLQRNPDASFVSGVTTLEETFRCLPNLEGAFCTSSSMRQEGLTRDEGGSCSLERTDVKSAVLPAGGDVRRGERKKKIKRGRERPGRQTKGSKDPRSFARYQGEEAQKS